MSEYHCENCGKEIVKRSSNRGRFCNHACYGEWQSKNKIGVNNPLYKGLTERICEACHTTFFAKPDQVARGWARFCSQKCKKAIGQIECTCHQCGNKFLCAKNQAERGGGKFCGKPCMNTWQSEHPPTSLPPTPSGPAHHGWKRIEVPCGHCGKILSVVPSDLKGKEHVFCDHTCYGKWYSLNMTGEKGPAWTGGQKKWRGPNWKIQRKAALERDGYKCQHCGISQKKLRRYLDVHHIIPFRKFGLKRYIEANDLSNLITLCQSCHMRAEHGVIPLQPRLV